MVTFIVAVAVSMGYYQFVYIPQANAKPILPEKVLHPARKVAVTIVEGASQQSQANHYLPKQQQVGIGDNNEVIWTNKDNVPHTVTSDDNYVDKISGPFNTVEQQDNVPGGYILPGKTFDFIFTHVGDYPYHCVPHPFMQGTVSVTESFS